MEMITDSELSMLPQMASESEATDVCVEQLEVGSVQTWQSLANIIQALKTMLGKVTDQEAAWILVHSDFGVGFGAVCASEVLLPPTQEELLDPCYLQEFRLFGLLGEWHVWRTDDGFYGRLLEEDLSNGTNQRPIDEHLVLWGTDAEDVPNGSWTILSEARGTRLWIPHDLNGISPTRRVRIHVRHYLSTDIATHLTTIHDSRLVALCDHDCKPLKLRVN